MEQLSDLQNDQNEYGYTVKVNGKAVDLETARVSAMPFNRRWPGHQRPKDQTEIAKFLLATITQPMRFEITPDMPFENVKIRPASLGIEPVVQNGVISFTLEKPAYFTVEPYGRHHALHLFVDAPASYDVDREDENVIYFGQGVHDAGVIRLQSGQTLWIDEGAVVYANVRAIDAENIRIIGRGILDNSKNRENILYEVNAEGNTAAINNATREHTVQLEYCTNVQIDGITIRDSLVYNIRPIGCRNLDIRNVKIIGCWRYNSDGIDMHNCEHVLISNCFIRTFDDSICVKGFDCYYADDVEAAVKKAMYRNGQAYDVFKDVRVQNCVIWNDWGRCLEIGAETRAEEICDVLFENCDVIHVVHNVLDCKNVDYADVHDVTYRNIRIEYDDVIPKWALQNKDAERYENVDRDYAPAVISAFVLFHPEYSAGGTRRGRNRNILFENIFLTGRQKPIFAFAGYREDADCSHITIRNFYHNGKKLTSESEYVLKTNEFCSDIRVEASEQEIASV